MEMDVPPRPDLRQSLCHTLLASAFVLLGVLNPFAGGTEAQFHWWMMVILVIAVAASWSYVTRRWLAWRELPQEIKVVQARAARYDSERAKSHLLMSALALLLTGFAFLGRAVIPDMSESLFLEALFYTAAFIALVSTTVFSRAVRDLFTQCRRIRNNQTRG